jgi:hypothetical protein
MECGRLSCKCELAIVEPNLCASQSVNDTLARRWCTVETPYVSFHLIPQWRYFVAISARRPQTSSTCRGRLASLRTGINARLMRMPAILKVLIQSEIPYCPPRNRGSSRSRRGITEHIKAEYRSAEGHPRPNGQPGCLVHAAQPLQAQHAPPGRMSRGTQNPRRLSVPSRRQGTSAERAD